MPERYVVWGYGNSWIIRGLDAHDRLVWKSGWIKTEELAYASIPNRSV